MKKKVINDKSATDIISFIDDKQVRIYEIINNTLHSLQLFKQDEILNINDVTNATASLMDIHKIILNSNEEPSEVVRLEILQKMTDKLLTVISKTGTQTMKDLTFLLMGEDKPKENNIIMKDKKDLIETYFHPIGFKNVSYKVPHIKYSGILCCDKITDDIEDINSYNDYECTIDYIAHDSKRQRIYNIETSNSVDKIKFFGMQFLMRNERNHKMYMIWGFIDNIILDCLHNKYVDERKTEFLKNIKDNLLLQNYLNSMSLRDILVTGNKDIFKREAIIHHDVGMVKNLRTEVLVKKVIDMDLVDVRNFMISLLLYDKESSDKLYVKYIAYLLYDIIIIRNKNTLGDNNVLYDSFPWQIKTLLKDSICDSIKYTDEINLKYDINRLSLEQQVYLLQGPELVKEKAIVKLKEIKSKGEDNNKAKQYLEGLLKIPFDVLREEPILVILKKINRWFKCMKKHKIIGDILSDITEKEQYTTIEIMKCCKKIKKEVYQKVFLNVKQMLTVVKTKDIVKMTEMTNLKIKKDTKHKMLSELETLITEDNIYKFYDSFIIVSQEQNSLNKIIKDIDITMKEINDIDHNLNTISKKLDDSIFGHNNAKTQILKVMGQWMTGKQKGYCFGFEGSPGIGKTSLAKKGLTHCLVDEDGTPRPFHFIALGGSSNGSTLEGHGYTYQNSTWGRIVDILMESKCMNPIIYIDELDKVSKTDHGREIIGILTHLIDSTQNSDFQDKYFSGIPINMSNVLFVFSYNNIEDIDPVLLDRIHRIKFDNLSIEEKIVIVKNYIFPELFEKMGWDKNILQIDDKIIKYIIETYTNEPGIRKLKELLFDMVGEINIEILKKTIDIPIVIDEIMLREKYLKQYRKIREKKIHLECHIGYINGLYANTMGQGGIIPIQCSFFPSGTLMDLKLTGLIGNVMQESMNIARNLAWNLTPNERKIELLEEMGKTKNQGIHIHCPEGGIHKDGPSGGCCITLAIYSLLNGKPLRNDVAITGEIDLHGNITAIGGLEFKILGGIKSGIVHFLFPEENNDDYMDIVKKHGKKLDGIEFTVISKIENVIYNEKLFFSDIDKKIF
jgi:ATP-dependent Lon protease